MTDITHPTRTEALEARENQERAAALVRSCAYCGEHSVLDGPVSHYVCGACETLLAEAADRDATDRDLVLMAVSAYGHTRYWAAVYPGAENTERMERAHTRVIRLLDQAMGRREDENEDARDARDELAREVTRLKRAAAETEVA